jgi:fumarylacetoacetase
LALDLSNGVPVPDGSPFTLPNQPFGVADGRVHIAVGDHAVDVAAAVGFGLVAVDPTIVDSCRLDGLLAAGPPTWRGLRDEVASILRTEPDRLAKAMVPRTALSMELPVTIGDYVDGYAGLHHATNLGRILRPGGDALQPNWKHLPVAYHGRAGTVVVGGGAITRPSGQVLVDGAPVLAPSAQLDIELELGAIVGVGNEAGQPIPIDEADAHLFGFVLVNDWSARDIQAWEYQPLGPFLGKSFATSVSPWVVTVDALAPHRVAGLAAEQDPEPLSYLRGDPKVPDLHLTVDLASARMRDEGAEPFRVGEVDLAPSLYWTPAQQMAHCTVNGATVRPGDLLASGTISGPDHTTQAGSLIERTWRGAEPFTLSTGEERSFLADGDEVVLDGWAGTGEDKVGFGPLSGTIVAAYDGVGS